MRDQDQKLGNRYELVERIGGGGMAVVYRARDIVLNRYVSVKILRSQFASDEEFVLRFRREAQAAASLSHPNIVSIYDVGTEGETHYIVMEYIDGSTLKEEIQKQAPMSVERAIAITRQICAALRHAHENNIVHRDIKPHNILIGKDGRVKVTDFGIARATTSNTVTHTGSVLGSVHYFSPEQARGGLTDVKSDIYSLGVVLYEMVTGKLPFSGESPVSVALKHLQEEFVEPREIRSDIPQSVENIILKALVKDPDYRYKSMEEMMADLDRALTHPNVPKFVAPRPMDGDTIQMPAVGILRSEGESSPFRHSESSRPGRETSPAPNPRKRRKWVAFVLWPLAILLVLGFAGAASYEIYTFISNNFSSKQASMPDLRGLTYNDAVDRLVAAGFKKENIRKTEAYPPNTASSQKIAAGQVFDQDPLPGTLTKVNRQILLTVSKGQASVTMPSLTGMTKDQAQTALTDAGIDPSQINFQEEYSADVESGKVTRQIPSEGSSVTQSTTITVFISKGKEMATMPDLTGLTIQQANSKLVAAGFTVPNKVTYQPSDKPKDTVISQSPYAPQTQAPKGAVEEFVLSSGTSSQSRTFIYKQDIQVNKKTLVTIRKTDSVDQGVTVFNQIVQNSVTVPISITLKSVDDVATIEIYKDGVLTDTAKVPYPQD